MQFSATAAVGAVGTSDMLRLMFQARWQVQHQACWARFVLAEAQESQQTRPPTLGGKC